MQHAQQTRQRVILVSRGHPVRPAQRRPPPQPVVAEPELPGDRVGQGRQPVQAVILIAGLAPVRAGETRQVVRRVVAMSVDELRPQTGTNTEGSRQGKDQRIDGSPEMDLEGETKTSS